MSLDFIVAIPARLASTRLPEKPLRLIAGRPMIAHVIERALAAGARDVVVATDDARIADVVRAAGVRAALTRADHPSGSDRLAEVAVAHGWDDDQIVVNLQGDEPLAPVSGIRAVAALLRDSGAPLATLATALDSPAQLLDPNVVKLVRNAQGDALYFSRAPLPWARDAFARLDRRNAVAWPALPQEVPFLRHIGIYAYRAGFLRRFVQLPQTPLERAEALEQLRALEHGHRIAVGLAPEAFPAGVDTEEDLHRVDAIVRGA